MRFTNDGRVRVTATHVQLGADEGVSMWHGATKLWPPSVAPKIKAVTVDTSYYYYAVGDYSYSDYWDMLRVERILTGGLGSASAGGHAVSRVIGNKVYFQDMPDYGDTAFAIGGFITIRCTMTELDAREITSLGQESGRFETSVPFNNESLVKMEFTTTGTRPALAPNTAYEITVEAGIRENGENVVMCSKNYTYSVSSGKKAYFVYRLDGIRTTGEFIKAHQRPDKFYISVSYSKIGPGLAETRYDYNGTFIDNATGYGHFLFQAKIVAIDVE